MARRSAIALVAITFPFLIGGCGTVPVNLKYRPASPAQRLAPDIRTVMHIAPVVDRTGGPDSFGGDINQQLRLKGWLRADVVTPYPDALGESLRVEMGRLGIPIVERRDQADVVLEPVLTKTLAYVKETGMTDVPVFGAFEFLLLLKDLQGQTLWETEIDGFGKGLLSAPGWLRVGAGPNDAMSGALANAMEQVGPRFIADNVVSILSRNRRGNP